MSEQKAGHPTRTRLYATFVVGFVLFGAALYIGQKTDLSETFRLDFQGQRAPATAERLREGLYRLKYTHTSGTIYTRSYNGNRGIPKAEGETAILIVAFDPRQPDRFQPAGLSYLPMAVVVMLSAAGATLIFYANHRLVRGWTAPR